MLPETHNAHRYAKFFQLSEDPFRAGSPHVVCSVGGFALTRDHLAEALAAGKHTCLLSSPPGLGKSALLRVLATDLESTGASVLLRSGNRWRSADVIVREAVEQGATILLLDDTQDLAEGEVIRLLRYAADTQLAILVTGQPQLETMVAAAGLSEGSADSMEVIRLRPLRPAEVVTYVEEKLALAGPARNDIFSEDALHSVAAYSAGVPRLIDRLCSASLYLAALSGHKRIGPDCVVEAAAGLYLSPPEQTGGVATTARPDDDRIVADAQAKPAGTETPVSTSIVGTARRPATEPPGELLRVPQQRPGGIDFSMAAGASWALAATVCFAALGAYLTPDQAHRAVQQAQREATTEAAAPSGGAVVARQETMPVSDSAPAGQRLSSAPTRADSGGRPSNDARSAASGAEPDMPAVVQPFRRLVGGGDLAEVPEPRPAGPTREGAANAVARALGIGTSAPEPDLLAAAQAFRRLEGDGRLAEAPESRPAGPVSEGAASAVALALGIGSSMPEPDMLAAAQPFGRLVGGGRLAEVPEPRPAVPARERAGDAVALALGTGSSMSEPDMLAAAQPFRRLEGDGRLAAMPEPRSADPDHARAANAIALALGTGSSMPEPDLLAATQPFRQLGDNGRLAEAAEPVGNARKGTSDTAGQAPRTAPLAGGPKAPAGDHAVATASAPDASEAANTDDEVSVPYTLTALGGAPPPSALPVRRGLSPQADQSIGEVIGKLLARARTQAGALKLTTPAGDNALETYRHVLRLMPEHAEALAGIRDIGVKYVALSRAADDPDRAAQYAEKAARLAPDHPRVRELLAERLAGAAIEARKEEPKARQRLGPQLQRSTIGNLQALRRALDDDARVDFHYADGQTPLTVAVAERNEAALELLLQHGADPNLPVNPDGGTALMYAAWNGYGSMVEALVRAGADPDRRNIDGKTALMAASINGYSKIAAKLLGSGADPDTRTRNGWTALMYAAWTKRRDIVDLIIDHRGDATITNDRGQTALDVARQRDVPEIAATLATVVTRPQRPN